MPVEVAAAVVIIMTQVLYFVPATVGKMIGVIGRFGPLQRDDQDTQKTICRDFPAASTSKPRRT
jgi:hypothetical protein